MNQKSSRPFSRLLSVALVPFLALTGALPLTGCDNGGGGSSSNSGSNVAAPTSLPAGLRVITPSGTFMVVDGTNYTFAGLNPADSNSGTYTYVANGTGATLTLTPSGGGSPEVITISNFTANNGAYTGATMQSAGEGAQAVTFSGVSVPYVAPSSGGSGSGSTTYGTPVAGSTYRFVSHTSQNDGSPIPDGSTAVINTVTSNTISITLTITGGSDAGTKQATFNRQQDGSYAFTDSGDTSAPWTNVLKFSSDASTATLVSTGSGTDAGSSDTYNLAKQ